MQRGVEINSSHDLVVLPPLTHFQALLAGTAKVLCCNFRSCDSFGRVRPPVCTNHRLYGHPSGFQLVSHHFLLFPLPSSSFFLLSLPLVSFFLLVLAFPFKFTGYSPPRVVIYFQNCYITSGGYGTWLNGMGAATQGQENLPDLTPGLQFRESLSMSEGII